MGIKLLNRHTIPWCLHLLGHHISCLHLQPEPVGTVKVMNTDGLVKIYDRPIHVSELMTEFPKHMVCRSDSFYIGQKIPALSKDDKLQLGHNYFLLPKQFFQSVLSFVTIASFANARSPQSPLPCSSVQESRNAMLKKASACQPFHIQKSSSGCLRIRVSDEFIWQLMEEGGMKEDVDESWSKVCTTPQLQKQYSQLVCSRHWKPKLETIKEMEKRKISSFGMKRKKKSQLKNSLKTHRSSEHHVDICNWVGSVELYPVGSSQMPKSS
ncbi:uncharacterized protein LOC111316066 [Durio zibethinus]|uniref:Uncharacterized protein LOC111316066 n=1 Tax=Durio zibethinus TaxID=66656 RepID=A0A6P6B9E1_DURZI|nr:uncharacterized protein LOC111316066 [Durio zibethinus]